MSRYSLGNQLRKRKELLYNLGAISSYSSMLIFLWHGIEMLISGEHPKHTLVLYAASSFFSILVMAPYKWDKKWMRIKTSVGIVVFGASLIIYLICVLMNWLWIQFVSLTFFKTCIVFLISLLLVGFIFWQRLIFFGCEPFGRGLLVQMPSTNWGGNRSGVLRRWRWLGSIWYVFACSGNVEYGVLPDLNFGSLYESGLFISRTSV